MVTSSPVYNALANDLIVAATSAAVDVLQNTTQASPVYPRTSPVNDDRLDAKRHCVGVAIAPAADTCTGRRKSEQRRAGQDPARRSRHPRGPHGGRMFVTDLTGSVYQAGLDGSRMTEIVLLQGNLTGIAYAEVPGTQPV